MSDNARISEVGHSITEHHYLSEEFCIILSKYANLQLLPFGPGLFPNKKKMAHSPTPGQQKSRYSPLSVGTWIFEI